MFPFRFLCELLVTYVNIPHVITCEYFTCELFLDNVDIAHVILIPVKFPRVKYTNVITSVEYPHVITRSKITCDFFTCEVFL